MSVEQSCRDIKQLNQLCQLLLNAAIAEIKENGVHPLVTETYRSKARQQFLYCQGRTVAEAVKGGVPKAIAIKYCNSKVGEKTWTMNSIHIKKNAVDLVPQRGGKAIYNTKDKDTQKVIKIMSSFGFEAGANWTSTPDSPHFQIAGVTGTTYSAANTNKYITKFIQKALGIKVDGDWGVGTTKAVNAFRQKQGWTQDGKVGTGTLKKLLQK